MTDDSETPKIAETEPASKSGMTVIVVLSVLLGVLLTLGAVGAYFHVQESRKLQTEVRMVRSELIQKNLSLNDMRSQIEALSMQINMLKDYSVARSGNAVDKAKKKENGVLSPIEITAPNSPVFPDSRVAKKNKPEGPNCELVGKSPEEQAATLKRCVSLMDGDSGKALAR